MTELNLPLVAQTLDFTCGAACFASMYSYFQGHEQDDMRFARELGTIELGYTPVENVVQLARQYGFQSFLLENADLSLISEGLQRGEVIFVTWWDEDAGHYSLVKGINEKQIVLMDPWEAREQKNKSLSIDQFYLNWSSRGRKIIRVFM
jgi:predicted double-glycine peptidase